MKMKPLLRSLFPWLLLAVLGCVLFVLNFLSRSLNDDERNQMELEVRQILTLDTRINLDVLRLRHRQLLGYDSLSNSSEQVDRLLARMQASFVRMGLPDTLKASRESWKNKELALDDFKRQNTVLVNSLYHFVNLSRALQDGGSGGASVASAVTRDVLIFVNEQNAERIPAIIDNLNRLEAGSAAWGNLSTQALLLSAHGRQIVNNHLPVQRLMQGMTNNSFPQDIERAYGEYIKAYSQRMFRAEEYRRLMAIFSLLMVASVVLIMLRLQQTASELERSHALLDNIADHLGEGILSFDAHGRINFMNQRAEILLGKKENDLIETDALDIWPRGEGANSAFRAAVQSNAPYEGEEWLQRTTGERFPAVFLGGPLPQMDDETQRGYVTSFRDVTVQRQAEERLRTAARVFDNLSEAMTIADANGLIQSVNAAFTNITGYTEAEAIGKTPGKLLGSGLHEQGFFRSMWRTLNEEGQWQGEIINRRKSGETYPEWLSITVVKNERGEVLQYIGLFSDISERKQAEAYIHHLAYHDPLTGLANRLLFNDRLGNAMQQAHRTRRPLAVMLFDLDHFKTINDSLGHHAGDLLLAAASERMARLLREGDTLARLNGDEFALLLPEITSHADAATLASRILQEFAKSFDLEGREIFISSSIGIAVYPSDGENEEVLLKNADIALSNAKGAGRAIFRFFLESDSTNSLELLELETDLRHSVNRNELRLYYQPQVNTRSGMIYGVEALVRWQHPTRGLLFPDRFIALAENCGYIDILGRWCLETACKQLVEWRKNNIPIQRVAVNVSARQLRSPDFVEMVLETVKATGIDPSCLELELTESSMSDDPERAFKIFAQLRETGIRVAIDDFGTGYSSLSYLSRYPVNIVKVDKSFIDHICGGEHDTFSVVQAIIVLAHTLKMETVAEGVETEEQRKMLTGLDCDLLQGYLFSRPCPAADLLELPCVEENE
ncbi:MAG: EAL domain-containing protein [Zoogloeaceae bacterium]|jgi:diguanylate cyclase (GGDEF)-like protein/PAS domain S-box-containing protein|nr:EAL domain-containing protein [Zoogloeaceae bacterium]